MEQCSDNRLTVLATRSAELGFAGFGIVPVSEVSQMEQQRYLFSLENGFYAGLGYLSRNIEKRFNPALLVEGAKSVLVFLAPYGGEAVPGVASYGLGEDYHTVIKEKLQILLRELPQIAGIASGGKAGEKPRGRVFTDSAPILERFWAVKAGLGFIGKNNFLISPQCGIKTLIGIILTDIPLPATPPVAEKKYCGNCTRCLDACPTGALCAPYTLDARKCISYLTIENKELGHASSFGVYPEGESDKTGASSDFAPLSVPLLDGWYFGCDACLNACPWNRKNVPGWPEFSTRRELLAQADAAWWEELSEEAFRDFFSGSPLLRGGLANIRAAHRLNEEETSKQK